MNFGFIPPPHGEVAEDARRLLGRAADRGGYGWDEVAQALDNGQAQLWMAVEDRPVAAMVTKLDGDTLEVWLAGGAVLAGAVGFLETAIAASREAGATNGRIWGRRGWDRVLAPYGWRRDGDLLTKAWG